jgi:hypothetical protein
MTMDTYTWANAEQTTIVAVIDGVTMFIPTDPANTDYAKLVADKVPIAPYVPPAPAKEPGAPQISPKGG